MKNNFQSKAVPRGTRTIWRYLSALFILLTFAIGNVWAADPDVDFTMSSSTKGDYFKAYTVGTNTVTISTSAGSISSGNGGYYIDLGSNASAFGSNYLGVQVSGGATISKVEILASGSGNNKSITAPVVGWEDGWDGSSTTADAGLTLSYTTPSSNGSKFSTAEWREADVDSWDATEVRIYKKLSSVTVTGYTLPTTAETIRIWGVRVYLNTGGVSPVCPSGLTISSKDSKTAFTEGDAIELTASLTAGNGDITYQWYKGGTAEGNKLTGKTTNKLQIASCTTSDAGDYYCVASKTSCSDAVNASAFAITVAADTKCFNMPAITSKPADLASVVVSGGTLSDVSTAKSVAMNAAGLKLDGNNVYLKVSLASASIVEGTKITVAWKGAGSGAGIAVVNENLEHKVIDLTGISDAAGSVSHIFTASEAANYADEFIIHRNASGTGIYVNAITVEDCGPAVVKHTITLDYNDGGTTPSGSIIVADGKAATKPADPTWAHHRFAGWYNGASPYDWTATVSGDLTLTAHWTQLYTVTYAKGDEGATGDAPTQADKAATETFKVAANTFELAGKVFDHWNDGTADYNPEDTYTVGTSNVTLTAVWRTPSTMYAITKGAHENGDFTISPAEQEEGGTVTLEATPDDGYLFGAWEVVKTEDASATGITVDANGQFTMPGYAVTVNATFVADPRKKILYVTNNDEATTKANDKLYAALKDDYRISIVSYGSDADQTNYDLVVLHESIGGSNYGATAVAAAKAGNTPVLNTKSYFYNDGRWGWGAPNAGQSVKGATLNSSYCNIADHPLFDGVTMTAGFFEITDDAAAKCMQPVGSFTSGKEGYTLATTPNNGEGNGCAIHELTPAQRGASAGKYLMISVSGDKLNALNANGQKLFQNAAAYLIGSTAWEPIAVPTDAVIEAAPSAAYSVGDNIALSALAAGVSAVTTYTWYKGDTWAEAETAGAIQAAKTAADSGDSFGITGCALGDEGTYWCVISNGTDCEAKASLAVTVTDASYNITFVSAHGTAPTATTGVSYTLPTLTESGWAHQGWTASIDVEVDAATVNAGDLIANGKMAVFAADVEFTAVWKQEFQVTFNLKGHGDPIAAQIVVDGELATEPDAPFEIGYDFGGWFTDADCTAGNEFDFATPITAATPLFAKWTEFGGCTLLYPATSGAALNVGDNIDLQSGSKGGSIQVVSMKTAESSIAYDARGLLMGGGSADIISVTLANDMDIDTKITVTLDAKAGGRPRGLYLLTGTGANVKGGTLLGWPDDGSENVPEGEIGSFSYTVEDADGLAGTNVFRLKRQNSTYIKCIKVESCGAAVVFHNLTSAVDPADKGTVTLGATSVREGYTTTAEYSAIDPLYEFVSWSVSGEGASIADASANPATITMGTEDVVVTLNLQLIPEKFTVNYFDDETPMGTEQVELNAHPTAAGIATAKRHYTFEGWAETKGGSVVDLNSITSDVVATINLYAKYAPVDCPTTGYLFSMEFDETKKPAETVVVAKNGGKVELADYATISGGNAFIQNDETSNKDAISTDGKFLLKATKEVMKIELDCALQLGDIIRIPDNNQKYVISTSNAKTGTYQQQTSSQHEFAVTSDWVGVDDIFILYDGSSLNFTQVYVYRPAKFTVSFDLKGHGAAIADLTNVPEGSKIIAPTAPTDENYSFSAWYKENELENEWDFAEDVVTANTTLFAKWINKSDATLKSLKYGSFDIALENDVYEYNIGLPNATVAVPALTAVTNNPLATAAISDATEFDGEGKATSTVEVTPEKEGAAHQTYTVHFTILPSLPQVTVAASTLWDFSLAGNTALQNQTDVVLANMPGIINDATFNAQALKGTFNKLPGNYFQGSKLMFEVEEEGMITIEFGGTNNNARNLQVCTGDEGNTVIAEWAYNNGTHQTKSIEVPAGKITLKAFEGEAAQNVRIYNLEYLTLINRREAAWVKPGELGTVCLKDNAKALGAKVFEVMGCNASGYMVFDEIESGEIEAGKPYLFEVTRNGSVAFFKTVGAAHSDDEIEVMGMIGTFDGETLHPGTGNYCYFSGRHIWRVNDFSVPITVPAYCCYVDYDEFKNHPIAAAAPAPGRRRVVLGVNGKDEAQGFENLNASETPMKVMIDGTLYILRGEKVFDATGRLMK